MAAAEPSFGSAPAAAAANGGGAGGGGAANGAATVAAAVSGSVSAGGVATPGVPKVVLKVVLLGNSGVGKTCLLNRYVDNTYSGSGYKATIGSDFKLKEIVVDGQPVTLQIWDTAGQERFASLGDLYHRGANICLLVFDITKTDTFEALQQWKDEFLASSALHGLEDGGASAAGFPFACIANKVDRHAERAVSQKRAAKWCSAGGSDMSYFETSAKDSTNVAQCFTSMTRRALKFMAESQVSVTKMMDKSANVVLEQRKRETAGCCS